MSIVDRIRRLCTRRPQLEPGPAGDLDVLVFLSRPGGQDGIELNAGSIHLEPGEQLTLIQIAEVLEHSAAWARAHDEFVRAGAASSVPTSPDTATEGGR